MYKYVKNGFVYNENNKIVGRAIGNISDGPISTYIPISLTKKDKVENNQIKNKFEIIDFGD
jgi:hypothetical protein